MVELLTVGHGTLDQDSFVHMLRMGQCQVVVDVRSYPGSRHVPWYARRQMQEWLTVAGLEYVWLGEDLGGRRGPSAEVQRDIVWRNKSFRNYAGYTRELEYALGQDFLLALARERRCAVMCAESVWWRCHRRVIADKLTLQGLARVRHLMPGGRIEEHRPTAGARIASDGRVVWDGLPDSSGNG